MNRGNGPGAVRSAVPRLFVALLVVSLASSCSKDEKHEIQGKLEVFPVEGKLLIDGEPAKDATVFFHPTFLIPRASSQLIPHATVDEDGSFHLTTYEANDGAPAGKYRVTVSWKGPLDGIPGEAEDRLPERLPKKYQNSRMTDLKVEVVEGSNVLETWTLKAAPNQVAKKQ